MNQIHYVDGLCGSGKTYQAIQYLAKTHSYHKTIVTVPSRILADQWHSDLVAADVNCEKITSDTHPTPVSAITRHVRNMDSGVLVITQAAWDLVEWKTVNKSEFTLIVDEIPAIDEFWEPMLPYMYNIVTNHLYVTEHNDYLYEVGVHNYIDTKGFLSKSRDDVLDIVNPLIKTIQDKGNVYVTKSSWDKVTNANVTNDDMNKIQGVMMRSSFKYTGWNRTIIMGANFKHSMLYQYWKDVTFVPYAPIQDNLRFNKHSQGNRIDIKWLQEKLWSRYKANQIVDDKSVAESMVNAAIELFDTSKPILSVLNKADAKLKDDNWTECPPICHGLNTYQAYDQVFFGCALNKQPQHINILNSIGFTPNDILRATTHEVVYQAIMRTSLRNPTDNKVVRVVVADYQMASYLSELFDGSVIEHPNNKMHRNSIPFIYVLPKTVQNTQPLNASSCDELDLNITIQRKVTSYAKETLSVGFTYKDFVKFMKETYTSNIINKKSDNLLMIPTTFRGDTKKEEDANTSQMIIIDIDDGDITPDITNKILKKYTHIICNTASTHEEGKENRHRVILFADRDMTPAEYRSTFKYIASLFGDLKGIDMGKCYSSAPFYLPCRVKGHKDKAFFIKHHTKDRYYKAVPVQEAEIQPVIVSQPIDMSITAIPDDIMARINDLIPGDRTQKSYGIAASCDTRGIPIEVRQQVLTAMKSMRISDQAYSDNKRRMKI